MLDYLLNTFLPTRENLGRLFIGGFFLAYGIKSALNIQDFQGMLSGINLPRPMALAFIAVGIKILGGISLVLNLQHNLGRWFLIFFTAIATFLMNNPIKDPKQFNNFGKNSFQ